MTPAKAVSSVREMAGRSAAGKMPEVSVRGTLATMGSAVQQQDGARPSGTSAKMQLDKLWDFSRRRDNTSPVSAGKGWMQRGFSSLEMKKGETDADLTFSAAAKKKAPQVYEKKPGQLRRMLVLPAAMAAIAGLPKLLNLILDHPALQAHIGRFLTVMTAMPGWLQTGLTLGTGFGAAWVLPKLVRAVGKWLFNQVDWDELRESYLVNLASAAAWLGAISFAVYTLGGFAALGVNAGLFAATMALANQDLAKNLASGLQLYRNREFEFDFDDEITLWGEKGRLESINIRFLTLDTSMNPDAAYNSVMMANEKVRGLGLTNHSKVGSKVGLLAAAALPLAALAPFFPYLAIAGLWLAGGLSKEWAQSIQLKAEKALPDRERYKKLRARSRLVGWGANASYVAGLGYILKLLGVSVSGVTSVVGILSAAAGFWTKEIADDLVAGLMIAVWRPFGKGEVVQIGKHPRGMVETITPRTIRLRLDDGSAHFVPLADLMKEKILIGLKPVSVANAG
ncbi:MAG: mechanosensitive ion channel domain-containing protein [Elusimicrobiota bacterium]